MCVTIARVEDASGLVRDERAMRERAFGGNVSLRDGPSPATDRFHAMTPFFPLRLPTLVPRLRFRHGNFLSADCIMREAQNAVAEASAEERARRRRQFCLTCGEILAIDGNPGRGLKGTMRAITVLPGIANSARLDDVPEPPLSDGAVLVRTLALEVCATDREILTGAYGTAPPGQGRLVLGHESLGTVESAPPDCGVAPGDLVVGIVRRPDPEPCPACATGEWDMCRNGRYTERGIKERHGYGAERFRVEPEFVVKIDPALGILGVLLEPASILAKAWDHTERIGRRARVWEPRSLLVTGAGPIGLLAALMGKQRGLDVHVLDHNKGG